MFVVYTSTFPPLQLNIVAYDSAYPEKEATATVTIAVLRNQNGPTFIPSSTYEKTIVEGAPVGGEIITVKAQDLDENVRYLAIIISLNDGYRKMQFKMTETGILYFSDISNSLGHCHSCIYTGASLLCRMRFATALHQCQMVESSTSFWRRSQGS